MAKRSDNGPLKVLVVGAGIGGLTAALGLRQQGHEVILFERSELAQETGAALHLAPNCHGLLRRLGIFPEKFGANPVHGIAEYNADGKLKFDLDLRKPLSIWQHPWMLCHRVQLHEELKNKATSKDGAGIPVVLRVSSRVVDVDCATATITLEDGTAFSGDLVLGADGVSSVTRESVVGDQIKPFGSGKSAFRFMVPYEQLRENPMTADLAARQGCMSMWVGNDRRVIVYPCVNNSVLNCVAIHPSSLSASKGEGWHRGASKEALLEVYKEFGPVAKAIMEMADSEALRVWTLLDMDRIPTWVKGRLALLGDAAHPFLPHQGQGGAIAIEDATSISALLPRNTERGDIPERLALYEKLRDERAHKIQQFTRVAGRDLDDNSRAGFDMMEFIRYNFGHDEWHNSSHALKKHLWSRNGDSHWRSPVSFGPMPGPRQSHHGHPLPAQDSKFVTHSVRFQTSATYLKTLFPTDSFSFVRPGTLVEASFQCTKLDQMQWLGGGGYTYFGLWIHGVQYQKKDGTKIQGTFLPVLFETLADPITTGREELGMPKLYCDIDVAETESGTHIACSWRGAKFVEIKMHGLKELPPVEPSNGTDSHVADAQGSSPQSTEDDGVLAYRYIPAVGKPGVADAEYPVFVPKAGSTTPRVVDKVFKGTGSVLEFMEGDWNTLPTLHHIASGFADIPVYNILESKIEEGHGVDDLSQVERIE